MKNKLLERTFSLFLLLLCGCSQNPNNEFKREYFSNGKIKSEVPIINGKEDGILKSFYENGNPQSQISMKNGLKDGNSFYFYPDGVLKKIGHYSKNIIDGDFISFDEKGILTYSTKYSKDEIKSYLKYDSDGNIIGGTPFMSVETSKDTIRLGEEYVAKIKLNFALPEWKTSIYLRTDSTKKDGEIFSKIGDDKEAICSLSPKELGEHIYKISMFQTMTNEKDSIIASRRKKFVGKYWVVK